jgi:Ca2+-binding RTX toxin-like protein
LWAIIANDVNEPFYGDADDIIIPLSVSDIKVYDLAKNEVTGLTMVYNNDESITVYGIQQGWTFEINSDTAFNAVQIDAATGTDTFKLGVFSYGESNSGEPIELAYDIIGYDGDGDSIAGTISATLYPAELTIVGDGIDTTLQGTAHTDYILGSNIGETIYGLDGDDILIGGGGDDILYGGTGNDQLTGGTGADTFVFSEHGSANVDHILDYSAAEGDKIDLSALLDGKVIDASNQNDYVKVEQIGLEVKVSVDIDGLGVGATWSEVAILDGYGTLGEDLVKVLIDDQTHEFKV